jgi:pSer/pThr/pTyr-binding forkhead associated (FHA) protein
MQLILRPVSDTRLEALIVTDSRLAIGRNEAQFARYDRSLTEKLSRQHAEIFERDGQILIRDLKSGNGTKVNGEALGDTPVRLKLDDEVEFGGLCYRVEHVGAAQASAASAPAGEAQVILTPAVDDGAIAAIVITKFPFLISRYSDIFAQYQKSLPDQVGVLSRSHAKIFVRDGAIYVQDLGSTNGTYVGDRRLASEPHKLETNDTVTFGDERFTYRVQVFVGALTVIEAKAEVEKLSPGTIFVNDASNFFEAYMAAQRGRRGRFRRGSGRRSERTGAKTPGRQGQASARRRPRGAPRRRARGSRPTLDDHRQRGCSRTGYRGIRLPIVARVAGRPAHR